MLNLYEDETATEVSKTNRLTITAMNPLIVWAGGFWDTVLNNKEELIVLQRSSRQRERKKKQTEQTRKNKKKNTLYASCAKYMRPTTSGHDGT